MKIIKEAMLNIPEVKDTVITEPIVMGAAKAESERNQEKVDKVVEPVEKFDRKEDCAFGAKKQLKPEEAEKELKKIDLEESLFDEDLPKHVGKLKDGEDKIENKFIPGEDEPFAIDKEKEKKDFPGIDKFDHSKDESIEEDYDSIEDYINQDMQNGNAYWIMSYTANAMEECDLEDEVDTMLERAKSSDYDNLCAVCQEYIDRCNEIHDAIDDDFDIDSSNISGFMNLD